MKFGVLHIRVLALLSICFPLPYTAIAQRVYDFELQDTISMDGIRILDGVFFVAEGWDGDKILIIAEDGSVTTFAEGLSGPIDIMNRGDKYYVSEWTGNQVTVLDGDGAVLSELAVSDGPGIMVMDDEGIIYLTHNVNSGSGLISQIDLNDQVTSFVSGTPLVDPGGIDIGLDGNLYVASFTTGEIVRIDRATSEMTVIATIVSPGVWKTGHLLARGKDLFVSGLSSHYIYKVSLNGDIETFTGTGLTGHAGGDISEAAFANPNGLVLSEDGLKMYVSRAFRKAHYLQVIDWSVLSTTEVASTSSIRQFPNPSNGKVFLESDEEIQSLSIYDLSGKLLDQFENINNTSFTLERAYPKGMVFIQIQLESGLEVIKVTYE